MEKNLLKILTIVFLFVAILVINTVSNATTVTVDVANYFYNEPNFSRQQRDTYNVGEQVTFRVNWQEDMQATGFTIAYSNDGLEFLRATIENNFYDVDEENVKIDVEWTSLEEVDKTSIDFTFRVTETGTFSVEVETITAFANGDLETPEVIIPDYNKATIVGVLYGDIDANGVINEQDINAISNYINGQQIEINQPLDMNLDGKVDQIDVDLITKKINQNIKLPTFCGDIDQNGVLNSEDSIALLYFLYGETELDEVQLCSADLNDDNNIDYDDLHILLAAVKDVLGNNIEHPNLPIEFGDVNSDGVIDLEDTKLIRKFMNNEEKLLYLQQEVADVNFDSQVNELDITREKVLVDSSQTGLVRKYINNSDTWAYTGIENETPMGEETTKACTESIFRSIYDANGFNANKGLILYRETGEQLESNDYVGTGTYVCFKNGEESYKLNDVIIYGDVTGDGLINAVDALALIKHVNKKILFENNIYEEAGKIFANESARPTAVDALAIVKHANGKYTINQHKDRMLKNCYVTSIIMIMDTPKVGELPEEMTLIGNTISINDGIFSAPASLKWYVNDGTEKRQMEENETFEEGKTYSVEILWPRLMNHVIPTKPSGTIDFDKIRVTLNYDEIDINNLEQYVIGYIVERGDNLDKIVYYFGEPVNE